MGKKKIAEAQIQLAEDGSPSSMPVFISFAPFCPPPLDFCLQD